MTKVEHELLFPRLEGRLLLLGVENYAQVPVVRERGKVISFQIGEY